MSTSVAPSLSSVVFQLAAQLEQYESDLEDLIQSSFEPKRYARLARELTRIQKLSGALPQLAADTIEVVMRHIELFRFMVGFPACAEPSQRRQLLSLKGRLCEVIDSMRVKCLRLLARA